MRPVRQVDAPFRVHSCRIAAKGACKQHRCKQHQQRRHIPEPWRRDPPDRIGRDAEPRAYHPAEGRKRRQRIEAEKAFLRSEVHTSELQSLMRISYAVFCLTKKTQIQNTRATQESEN